MRKLVVKLTVTTIVLFAPFTESVTAQSLEETKEWLVSYLSLETNPYWGILRSERPRHQIKQRVSFSDRCTMEVEQTYIPHRDLPDRAPSVARVPLGALDPERTEFLERSLLGEPMLRVRAYMRRDEIKVGDTLGPEAHLLAPTEERDVARAIQALSQAIRLCGGRSEPF